MKKENIVKIFIMFLVFASIIFISITTVLGTIETNINIDYKYANEGATIGNAIAGILQVVGIILSVIILMVLGIKYMMGSVAEKAELKKSLPVYLIGAALVSGTSIVAKLIYDVVSGF